MPLGLAQLPKGEERAGSQPAPAARRPTAHTNQAEWGLREHAQFLDPGVVIVLPSALKAKELGSQVGTFKGEWEEMESALVNPREPGAAFSPWPTCPPPPGTSLPLFLDTRQRGF